ncbi:MAG: hypothetical protein MUE96_11200 [Bacteroidia bacterium]|jgi:hypothetical protein|nr:hypothetical protein [Bacteroidia bacterium]
MKIRIKGNSIRLRLTRSEVDRFGKEGRIVETTQIGNQKLSYCLTQTTGNQLEASFENATVTVGMPKTWANEWVQTERVGYESNMPLDQQQSLYLLVEKDFVCLDQTNEDQSDNYPNPLAATHP